MRLKPRDAPPSATRAQPPARRIVIAAGLLNTFASLPRFLLGPLAVLISQEMDLSESQVGAAVSLVVAVSAIVSFRGGRFVEDIGAYRAMTLVALISAAVMLGIAIQARSYLHLLGWMALSGIAMSMVHPSAALAIAGGVVPGRQGVAFGVKQSAPTTASLLAGFAVPTLGLTVGWRWAYVGGAIGALLLVLLIPRRTARKEKETSHTGEIQSPVGILVIVSAGMVFAVAAVSAMSVFYVLSAVDDGISVGAAGVWVAFGSILSIVARLAAGWLADRYERGGLRAVALLMMGGSVGVVLLGRGDVIALFALGTILAFAAGWGWPGLFQLTITRHNEHAPAAATGITQTGVFVGSAAGPLVFGWMVESTSYDGAWWATAAALLAGGLVMLAGHRALTSPANEDTSEATVEDEAMGV